MRDFTVFSKLDEDFSGKLRPEYLHPQHLVLRLK